MSTKKNLETAFSGESQANRKYTAFARQADKDGFKQIARLFRAAAEAETVHALAHFRAEGGIKDTVSNLEAAVAGEAYEFQEMYPPFLAEAEKEGTNPAAVKSFKYALAVEKVHHALYNKALTSARAGKDLPETPMFVCGICGHTVEGGVPDKCEVCGAGKSAFVEVK